MPSTPRSGAPPAGDVATTSTVRLGDHLLAGGLVDDDQLADALRLQQTHGGMLGRHLLDLGALTRRQLTAALAELWGLGVVDLLTTPVEPGLLSQCTPGQILADGWIAYRDDGGLLHVATTTAPDESVRAQVAARYPGREVRFAATGPLDLDLAVLTAFRTRLRDDAGDGFARTRPDLSAHAGLTRWQTVTGWGLGMAMLAGLLLDWRLTVLVLLLVANAGFLAGTLFKAVAFTAGWLAHHGRKPRARRAGRTVRRTLEEELPPYTILVPAYGEANVIRHVLEGIDALDYPKNKLQVLLLLEEDDTATIAAAKAADPPEYVRILTVPDGRPRTKPRACNLGLAFATGTYLVIFDAEDRPEPDQLRAAVAMFAELHEAEDAAGRPRTVCLQARLNYFNATRNLLTRMFALEYSMWFDYMLTGLRALHLPIPLGGTSNHFDVAGLRALGGWDAWNVTEDADLGVRAAALGQPVDLVESTTWEEACSRLRPWIRQRTRWVKGYMVTALVYARHPVRLWRATGWRGLVGMGGLIAGTPASFLAVPVAWAVTICVWSGWWDLAVPDWVGQVMAVNMAVGNGLMVVVGALGAVRRRAWHLIGYAVLTPVYWLAHAWAAWRAAWQVLRDPFTWEKTPHGLDDEPAPPASCPDEAAGVPVPAG